MPMPIGLVSKWLLLLLNLLILKHNILYGYDFIIDIEVLFYLPIIMFVCRQSV